MKHIDYTPEEIADMNDRNENFVGTTADFSKMQLYQQIKSGLVELLQVCPNVSRMEELAPNLNEQNAVICLDVMQISTFDKKCAGMLAYLMEIADRVILSTDGKIIRFSFCVERIWKD